MFINSRLTACIALLLNVFISQAVSQAPGLYPQASKRLLTEQELRAYDNATLKIMRNEIFARYGYIFKTSDMVEYFSKQSWYKPTLATAPKLTSIEEQNVALIKSLESGASTTPQLRSFATISKPMFPETALRDLTRSELEEYSLSQLVVMRNEIVARFGYIFKDKEIAQHFTKQPWYKPVLQTLPKLSAVEQSNLELLDKMIGERNADKKVQVLPSQGSTKFYTKQLTQKQLPKEIKYKGKFDDAYEWGDKDGIHIIIAFSNINIKKIKTTGREYVQSANANFTIYRKQVNGYQPIWADTVSFDGDLLGDSYNVHYTINSISEYNSTGYGVVNFDYPYEGRTDMATYEEKLTEYGSLYYRGKTITYSRLREPLLSCNIDTISNNIEFSIKQCNIELLGEVIKDLSVAKALSEVSLCTSVPLIIGQIRKAHVFKIERVTSSFGSAPFDVGDVPEKLLLKWSEKVKSVSDFDEAVKNIHTYKDSVFINVNDKFFKYTGYVDVYLSNDKDVVLCMDRISIYPIQNEFYQRDDVLDSNSNDFVRFLDRISNYFVGYSIDADADSDLKQCEKLSVGEAVLVYNKTYIKKITKLKEFDVKVTKLEP